MALGPENMHVRMIKWTRIGLTWQVNGERLLRHGMFVLHAGVANGARRNTTVARHNINEFIMANANFLNAHMHMFAVTGEIVERKFLH